MEIKRELVDRLSVADKIEPILLDGQVALTHKDCQEEPVEESTRPTGLSCQLAEIHEHVVAAEVQLKFVKTEYESLIEKLVLQFKQVRGCHEELQKVHFDMESPLNRSLATETHQSNENAELMTTVHWLRSELEASVIEIRVLSESISVLMPRLEEFKRKTVILEAELDHDSRVHNEFNYKLEIAGEEICELIFCNTELEIIIIVLKDKPDGQKGHIALMEKSSVESFKDRIRLMKLDKSCLNRFLEHKNSKTCMFT
ncbi:hypothetical protein DCAR_0935371 [Daucus carota subsp. sativus]|uniref:Uncharacterized protein n=1 Tax=Daucus carota subsp. sativus TaxID=79200 RepID=A0A175YI52_DAUCS|nr:hypothetical protein DCAR_0935371 [Daucus carota subsp. sativus]